jgi:hypothetical protein
MAYSSSSSSSSPSTSPIHKASLVDSSLHSPVLLELLDVKLSSPVIDYVVDCVLDTVDYALGRPACPKQDLAARRGKNPAFVTFVNNVITRAEITTPIVLASLVYIDRAKPHLHIALEEWASERVFLGAIMVASKYLNDSTLKNLHWALCTGVFGKRDVGRIEREFLDVLDFQLGIAEDDLLSHHDGISAVTPIPITTATVVRPLPIVLSNISQSQTHHRHKRSSGLPDLAPPSPVSTSSSSSASSSLPSTPSTSGVSSPVVSHEHASASSTAFALPDHAPPAKSKNPFHIPSSTMDLLRAFPIPKHYQHSRVASAAAKETRLRRYRPLPELPLPIRA